MRMARHFSETERHDEPLAALVGLIANRLSPVGYSVRRYV